MAEKLAVVVGSMMNMNLVLKTRHNWRRPCRALAIAYRVFPELLLLASFASTVAALAVTKKGAQSSLPNRQEVELFIMENASDLLNGFRAITKNEIS